MSRRFTPNDFETVGKRELKVPGEFGAAQERVAEEQAGGLSADRRFRKPSKAADLAAAKETFSTDTERTRTSFSLTRRGKIATGLVIAVAAASGVYLADRSLDNPGNNTTTLTPAEIDHANGNTEIQDTVTREQKAIIDAQNQAMEMGANPAPNELAEATGAQPVSQENPRP